MSFVNYDYFEPGLTSVNSSIINHPLLIDQLVLQIENNLDMLRRSISTFVVSLYESMRNNPEDILEFQVLPNVSNVTRIT